MLSQEYIDAFADGLVQYAEQNKQFTDAALEYARRAQKGLPADRFANGTDGERMTALGIDALRKYGAHAAMVADMWRDLAMELMEQQKRAGIDAMRLHTGDSKYAQKQGQ